MDEKELQALYNAMSKQFDVGDWNSFKGKMQTTDQRKNFYDAINKNGYDLGDYNEFEGRIAGTVKKKGGVSEALSIGSSEGAKKPSLSAIGEIGGRAGTSNGSSPQSEKQRLTDFIQGTKAKPTKEDYAAAIAKQDAVLPVKKKEKLTKPQVEEEAIRRFNSPLAIKERQDKKSELPSVPINEDDPIGNRINQIGSEIKNQEKTFDILSEDATDKLNELSVKEKQAELIRDYSIKDSHEAKYITQQLINKNSDTPFEGDLNQYPIEEIQKRVPNTITGKIAFEKYARRRIIDEADFNNATIDEMAAKLYGGDNLKDLPEAKAGRLIDEFLSDPDVIEKTKESAAFNNKYNQAKFDLFNKYPSYAFKKVSETIAQKLEDEELTGWLYANPNIDKVQRAIDMLKAEGKWDDKMNDVYEKEIMPSVMVGNADKVIPLTDLSHRFGYGLYEGGTAISNSIRDFTNKATGGILDSKGEGIFQKLGLYDSNEERTQKLEQQQESLPMVEGKRFTTKYLGDAAHFTGFMSPMLLGNAMGIPHLAMTALLFEGNNADKARMHFKDDIGKQNLYTLLSTGIDLFAMQIIPTKKAGDKLKELFKKDAIDIIENLSNNTISRSVAEKTFLEKGTQYLKDVGKGNISTANGLTAFTFLHNTLDAAFGKRDFSLEGELREAVSNYKINFLSGTFLSGISAIKGREASPLSGKVLREAAENGEIFADMIRGDNKLSESDKAERLGNLEYIEAVDRILQNRKLAPEQREAYLKSSLQQKIAEEKIKASPEKTLSKENEREVKIAEVEKEHILNPMTNSELLENMYDFLPKVNKAMLTTDGKFDKNKVGEYLKFVAQQANGLGEDWKPNGKEPSMSGTPESVVKAANERWSKEIEASKEPIEGHMKFGEETVEQEPKIEEPTVSETEGAGSGVGKGALEYPASAILVKEYNAEGDNKILTGEEAENQMDRIERTIAGGVKKGLDENTIMKMLNANGHVFNYGNDIESVRQYVKNRIDGTETRPFEEFRRDPNGRETSLTTQEAEGAGSSGVGGKSDVVVDEGVVDNGLSEGANKILGLHDNGVNFDLFDNNKLREIAKENGIDLPEGAKNADIIEALKNKRNELANKKNETQDVNESIGTEDNTETILATAEKKGGIYAQLAKAVKNLLGGVKTTVYKNLSDFAKHIEEEVSTHGAYDESNKTIHINNATDKNKLHIFFHEALHHITIAKIKEFEKNPNSKNLTPSEFEAILNLKRIYKQISEKVNRDRGGFGKQSIENSPTNLWMLGDRGTDRGFANVHEFISEAFTNPEFQKILSQFKGEGKEPNLFKQFVNAVAKMLGLKDPTILDDIFHHTEKLIDKEQSLSKQESGGKAPVTKPEGKSDVVVDKASNVGGDVYVSKMPKPEVPISEMNSEQLENHSKSLREYLKNQEVEFFGKEGAKKYREARSISYSTTASKEAVTEADRVMKEMEDALPKEQYNDFFGINQPEGIYDPIEIRDISTRVRLVEESENAQELGGALKLPLLDFSRNQNNEGTLAILNAAKKKAEELGIDPKEVFKESIKRISKDISDKNDQADLAASIFDKLSKPKEQQSLSKQESGGKAPVTKSEGAKNSKGETAQSRAKKVYKDIGEIDEPSDARGLALEYLAGGGKVSESSINEVAGTVQKASLNTGAKEKKSSEVKARDYVSKDGKTIEEVSHSIWDNLPEELRESVTTQELKNELMNVVNTHNTRLEAAIEFRDRYIAKDVRDNLTETEAKELNDTDIARRSKIVEELPENQQNELIDLLAKYENEYGIVDWERLEKDSNGFSPDILSLSNETQKSLDAIIQKNISQATSELNNATDKDGGGKKEKAEERLTTAQSNYNKAAAELKKAEDKISQTQATQSGMFDATQKEMFGVDRTSAKEILDPLRQKVKESKSELDAAQKSVDNINEQPKIDFKEPTKDIKPEQAEEKPQPEKTLVEDKQGVEKKVGKYEAKARELADKILKAELPSWMKADLPEGTQKQGFDGTELKKLLADATVKMGKLLDTGVEFAEAVKQAVKDIVDKLGESNRERIEEGFAEEYRAKLNDVSGIKKALVSEEIIKGVDLEKIGDKEMMVLGRKILDTGEVKPEALVTKIITEGKGVLTPTEVVGLITYKRDIDNSVQDAYKKYNEKLNAGDDTGTLGVEIANLERQINDFDVMAIITAQQQSMAFRLRQRMLDREYNVVTQIERYKKNNSGYIPPEVEAKFRDLDKQLKEVKAKLAEAEKKAEQKEGQESVDNIKESVDREKKYTDEEIDKKVQQGVDSELNKIYEQLPAEKKRAGDKAIAALQKFRAKLKNKTYESTLGIPVAIADLGAVTAIRAIKVGRTIAEAVEMGINRIKKALKEKGFDKWGKEADYRKDLTETLEADGVSLKQVKDKPIINEDGTVKIPNQMLRDLVSRGLTEIEELTTAVHKEVVKDFPDVTERQVRDYITDYGKEVNPTADQLQQQVNTAKRVGRLLSELEDVQSKIKKVSNPANKVKLTDRERELKRKINSLKKDTFSKDEKTPEQQLFDAKERTKTSIDELNRKIKNKDFAKPVKKTKPTDTELKDLEHKKELLQEEFDKEQYKLELKNRKWWQKAEDIALEIFTGISRTLVAGVDLSAGLVQGVWRWFRDPKMSARATGEMFRQFASEKRNAEWFSKLKASGSYEKIKQSKLAVTDEQGRASVKEGLFIVNWANKIYDGLAYLITGGYKPATNFVRKVNPIKASQRAFDGYVNYIRVAKYLDLVRIAEKDGYTIEADPKIFEKLADHVNTTTDRGSMGALETSSKWLSVAMFAPRKVISEIKLFTPYAFLYYAKMPKYVRQKALLDFAKFAASYVSVNTAIWAASQVLQGKGFDDDDDHFWDITSSQFFTHRFGNTRLNIGGGMKSALVFQGRLYSGVFTDQYGKSTKLGDRFGKQVNTRLDLGLRYLMGKASPGMGATIKKLDEKKGLEVDDESLMKDLIIPMWMQDAKELYKEHPSEIGTLFNILSIFGANVRTVEPKKQGKSITIKDPETFKKRDVTEKEQKKYEETKEKGYNTLISDYERGKQTIWVDVNDDINIPNEDNFDKGKPKNLTVEEFDTWKEIKYSKLTPEQKKQLEGKAKKRSSAEAKKELFGVDEDE